MKLTLERSVTEDELTEIAENLKNASVQASISFDQSLEIVDIGPCKLLFEDGMLKLKCEI